MKDYMVKDIRNIAVLGHGSEGKTTLVESMLYAAGVTDRQGRVEDGGNLLAAHAVKTQQIFALHAHSLLLSYRTTLMSPSNSGTRTPTSSLLLVGRFLPT